MICITITIYQRFPHALGSAASFPWSSYLTRSGNEPHVAPVFYPLAGFAVTQQIRFVFQDLPEPNRACLVGVYAVTLDPLLSLLWSPYVIGQTIIFSSCFFLLLLLLLSFFCSPNLSSRRLDVYHTSAHGVVLV